MRTLRTVALLALLTPFPGLFAQGIPVIDSASVAQAIQAVFLATQQLDHAKAELDRLGDPRLIKTPSANQLLQSLTQLGVGRTLAEIQSAATGTNGTRFNAEGLYRSPTETLQTAGGAIIPRAVQEYRKFDAVAQAAQVLDQVLADTERRRQDLRKQIQRATRDLQGAGTIAEIQKLDGLLNALNAELGSVDRERDTALGRLVAQQIYNQTDADRQKLARREEAEAGVRQATESLGHTLKVDTSTVRIPSRPAR
jgi:hypothetical protein